MKRSGRSDTTSTMSGKSTRSDLSTSIRRKTLLHVFRQACLHQRRFARAPRTGQQHVVGRQSLHKLQGVALDFFFLPIDLLQIGQTHLRHMAHRLQTRHVHCCACGSERPPKPSSRARPAVVAAPIRCARINCSARSSKRSSETRHDR